MKFKDYYKILELENNKVTIEEIKIAFREQAKKYHPDVSTDIISEERFKDINEAYRILSQPASKRKYDRIWYSNVGKRKQKQEGGREKKSSFLNILFGEKETKTEKAKNKKQPIKGENIETEIKITIEEAYYGANKKISLRAIDGKIKTFTVKIPAGIRNGEKIRLIGQGKTGQNGGKSGDLFIKIEIQDTKQYKLRGYDIYTNIPITPWEAVLGTRKQIEGISEEIKLYIPQGTSSGEKIKITGKGYKDGKGGRGDFIAQIEIVIPKKPSEEEVELYKKIKEISKIEPIRNI